MLVIKRAVRIELVKMFGDRVKQIGNGRVESEDALPYIVIGIPGNESERTMVGTRGARKVSMRIAVYAVSMDEADTLANEILERFEAMTQQAIGDGLVVSSKSESPNWADGFIPDPFSGELGPATVFLMFSFTFHTVAQPQ